MIRISCSNCLRKHLEFSEQQRRPLAEAKAYELGWKQISILGKKFWCCPALRCYEHLERVKRIAESKSEATLGGGG